MSSTFLAMSAKEPGLLPALARGASRYLPFVAEQEFTHVLPEEKSGLWAWSVLREAARGSFWSLGKGQALAYNGWLEEDRNIALDRSVADGALEMLQRLGPEQFTRRVDGDWSLLRLREDGGIDGLCDFLGGQHLYYGERNGVAALSNRAFLIAAALNNGELPSPNASFLAWLLTSIAAPMGDGTAFEHVSLLDPNHRLQAQNGAIKVLPIEAPTPDGSELSWEEVFEQFKGRASQVKRLPDLGFRVAVTGGKDSRTVLGGLVAADALDAVDYAFLHARPDHPDVIVGRKIAEHYGLEFRLFEPLDRGDDFIASLGRHNFQTELSLNAWDLKGYDTQKRIGGLHGTYGEIYRGHTNLRFALGWKQIEAKYLATSYIDVTGILSESAQTHCRRELQNWLQRMKKSEEPRLDFHDTYHRQMRMHRWMGQAQLSNACATLAMAPIHSARLLAKYRKLSVVNRENERIHFELMHRSDPWLTAQPFANARWSPTLLPAMRSRAKPVKVQAHGRSRQMLYWQTHRKTITDYLRNPAPSEIFDIVDAARLNILLDNAGESPDFVTLRGILGAAGIRQALDEPLAFTPISLEKAMPQATE